MIAKDLSAPPRSPAGPAPLRLPRSIRRTSSIDVAWPDGHGGNMHLVGRSRDAVTMQTGDAPIVCAEDAFEIVLAADRAILKIAATPPRPALTGLIGKRGGGGLRKALEDVLPDERAKGTPLYMILDDVAGASLVAGWAWSQWNPDWLAAARAALAANGRNAFRDRAGVCIGFAPGSSAFDENRDRSGMEVPDLRHPDDPEGWHAFTSQDGKVGMRRARRIDVWLDGQVMIDSGFQDSATTPGGGRNAIHEYKLAATADAGSFQLLSVNADPRILPMAECPSAAANLHRLLRASMPELREKVLLELPGVAGCTHLNDALRALADVPPLFAQLQDRLNGIDKAPSPNL